MEIYSHWKEERVVFVGKHVTVSMDVGMWNMQCRGFKRKCEKEENNRGI